MLTGSSVLVWNWVGVAIGSSRRLYGSRGLVAGSGTGRKDFFHMAGNFCFHSLE
jgi:hypothetical protein